MNTSPSHSFSRREFIRTTAQAAAIGATVAAPWVARGRVLGANDRIGIGFIGVGGRGFSHVNTVKNLIKEGEQAQIVAVNDSWKFRRDEVVRQTGAKAYLKHAELLADSAVDAVCIATPDRL
ncbi:MAG TPA: Gfo/Idh/MocA family oxidoreductase, partial [Verrucomicrobiota bacterium]|nr:Gfo/Idh/MocA family oxidoreductase [Verrucomicrobiota bacterium]